MRKIKPTEPTIGNLESQQQAKFDGYFGISILLVLHMLWSALIPNTIRILLYLVLWNMENCSVLGDTKRDGSFVLV